MRLLLALPLTGLALTALSSPVFARGTSPYLPLNLDPEIERKIEQVLILADKPLLTRPIAAAAVLDALPRACAVDEVLCESVKRYLERYMHLAGVSHASVGGAAASGEDRAVPNRHGLGSGSEWDASARAYWQPFDHALLSLGGVAYDGEVTPTGSLLSLGWSALQLDVGWRDHWLSPLTDSAMLWSTEAATMPSVTLSNYAPLTRLGIRYEVFAAQMSESDTIAHQGALTSGHPGIAGLHLSIEPARGWSLGVSRVLQFGGGARSASFGDVVKAFFNPSRFDNRGSESPLDAQLGNQLASITSRFVFPGPVPFAVYAEYAGEDTSHARNYLLGNSALSIGVDFPRLWKGFDFTYEASEWQNGWYVNSLYGDGLTNEERVIGHWGGDQRLFGDAVGAQTHMIRIGWSPPFGGVFDARYRTIANESYSAVDYQRGHDFTLRYSRPWRELLVGAEVYAGRDVFGEDFSRVGAFVRYEPQAAEATPRTGGSSAGGGSSVRAKRRARPKGAEIFVDVGTNVSGVQIDLDNTLPKRDTGYGAAFHVAIGARRAVSERQDLGVRLELDEVDDELLLGVRAFDYRFRIGRHLALTGFLGAARYDLATPAYGVYFGLGAQWRDLFPGWDVGLDGRYALKIARDDLLPGDPQGGRPDSFYDIASGVLYISRRF